MITGKQAIIDFKKSDNYSKFISEVTNAAKNGDWTVELSFQLDYNQAMFLHELGYEISNDNKRVYW